MLPLTLTLTYRPELLRCLSGGGADGVRTDGADGENTPPPPHTHTHISA